MRKLGEAGSCLTVSPASLSTHNDGCVLVANASDCPRLTAISAPRMIPGARLSARDRMRATHVDFTLVHYAR